MWILEGAVPPRLANSQRQQTTCMGTNLKANLSLPFYIRLTKGSQWGPINPLTQSPDHI